MISLVVPTIRGREHWLERCEAAYAVNTDGYELIVVPDKPTVGIAWQAGIEKAQGDYIHLSADDIEVKAGWAEAAIACCDKGSLPAPLIYNTDGTVQSCGESWERLEPEGAVTSFTRLPFLSRKQVERIGPVAPLHYYSDNWISWRGRQVGIATRVCCGYQLTHHLAPEGRIETRLGQDGRVYNEYVDGLRDPLADLGRDPVEAPMVSP